MYGNISIHQWRHKTSTSAEGYQRVDTAWKVLDQVVGLVKHAETKAIASLATAGVLGQILLTFSREPKPIPSAVSAVIGAFFVIAASFCAACVLWPRTTYHDSLPNLLYFGTISTSAGLTPEAYQHALAELTRNPEEILDQVGAQIWANAAIARRKFRFANFAVGGILAATVAVTGAAGSSLR